MKALVLGGANCVYADAEAALDLFTPDIVAAVNSIGIDWPGHIHHWFTLHPDKTKDWPGIEEALRLRKLKRLNKPVVWGFQPARFIDRVTPDWSGSSGLFAVKGLRELGCMHIVLAGVPMTKLNAHYNNNQAWEQAEKYHRGWHRHLIDIQPFVRSMSGWTKSILGAPTAEWLASEPRRK